MVFLVLIILIIICLKIRLTRRKNLEKYSYPTKTVSNEIEKESSHLIPIRSYINYLQMCYSSQDLFSEEIKFDFEQEFLNQFKYILNNNQDFLDYLIQSSIKTNNKKILNHLILTQRYNLKNLLKYNNPLINLNICLLTSYEIFQIDHIHHLLSQLYSQLKLKISSGPIDAIEENLSYYSLNQKTILHDQTIEFKSIQLIIHIDGQNNISLNITCLTCDTITQIKEKILYELNLSNKIPLNECKLYLLTNPSSYSSSSSTASSSVPLIRKSLLTQVCLNSNIKYSTTIIDNDSYHETNMLLLNDIDNTNQQVNSWIKLNTLQHYGIYNDGYEFKLFLPNIIKSSSITLFNYLTLSKIHINKINHFEYIHLLNHTYEDIENNSLYENYRLFETKSSIHTILIQFIDYLFQNLIHYDLYLNELIKEYSEIFHIFYGHYIPFILQNISYLFDLSDNQSLHNSFDILANIFHIGCYQQQQLNKYQCVLCVDLIKNQNLENCRLLFTDEIERVRLYYTNLESFIKKQNLLSEYSSTNTVRKI